MSQSPRRLTFAVGTSLLTASLATAACASKQRVNTRPEALEVNEGPATDPEEQPAPEESPAEEDFDATTDGTEEPKEEPRTVNVRHE